MQNYCSRPTQKLTRQNVCVARRNFIRKSTAVAMLVVSSARSAALLLFRSLEAT